jgi:methylated-DNA-[protein]-cysteine S-methyltransferase
MDFFEGYYQSPIGVIEIKATIDALVALKFLSAIESTEQNPSGSKIISATITQLNEYFNLKRKNFDLPVKPEGTDFQIKVWEQVSDIPFGQTASYMKIAFQLGSVKNTRAVGMANGKNPLPVIIPCHRVIGENGELTGYSGGLWRKKWLIEHEAREKQLSLKL